MDENSRDIETTQVETYEHWHEADRRALAMARLIVTKIDADPSLLETTLSKMKEWKRERGGYQPQCFDEWEALIITEPWARLRARLLEDSDEGQRHRTSHPFVDILSDEERESVYDFDWPALKASYERRTGRPWPTSAETLPGQLRRNAQ